MTCLIYTFGYAGRRAEDLERIVYEHHAMLVDIRFSPRSRAPEWSGAALCRRFGQDYLHLRALGNRNYRGEGPVELVDPAAAVEILRPILERQPVILLCVCRDHRTCHRSDAARELAERLGAQVKHL
jgi:uncharacterized protein (DUF488 family)